MMALMAKGQGKIGQTEVRSYARAEYGGGAQNWAMVQDKNNRLYVANNEGLLVYNGTKWHIFPVPNKTILRSIGFGPGGNLYAGAQDEIGYYSSDPNGILHFTSLKDRLPETDRNFPDVWDLETTGNDVFFRTNAKLFKLTNGKFTLFPAVSNWISLHKHEDKVLAQDEATGLMIFEKDVWQTYIPKKALPPGLVITDITNFKKDTSLLGTTAHGLFLLVRNQLIPFRFTNTSFASSQHITSLTVLKDSSFLIGTYFNGLFHLDKNGRILENISTKNGIANNTVRFVFEDSNGNVWAGLDNGLGLFSYNNPISHICPPSFNNGAGYTAAVFKGNIYFALSTGLQCLPLMNTESISSIASPPQTIMNGLTWNVSVVGDQLLAGRDDGLWRIDNSQASKLSGASGYWGSSLMAGTSPSLVAAGNYSGIEKYRIENGTLKSIGSVRNFTESSRYIETDAGVLWVSHPYRGVYKINLYSDEVSLFTKKEGLPDDLNNHVFKIKGRIVFATTAGIYEYDSGSKKMIESKEFFSLFGKMPIRYLKEDAAGNIWFVQDKMLGVADYSSGQPVIQYIPELNNKIVSGFESIFPYNNKNVLIGSEAGFFNINYQTYKESLKPFSTYLTQIKTIGSKDSVLFGGYVLDSSKLFSSLTIPFKLNSLSFSYASSFFGPQTNLEFSYYLDGFDQTWSNWTNTSEKEYTNLPSGTYTFRVKARNSQSHESTACQYTFTISPPWYKTLWAYLLYTVLSLGLLLLILQYQAKRHQKKLEIKRQADKKKFEEEQLQTAYRHQQELEKSEKELIQLKNEKLEAEIAHKNTELANATMNLLQKREFILKLKAELQQLQKSVKMGEDTPELKKLLKALAEEEKLDDEWEQFSQHFNSVHGDFLTALKKKFPTLKPHELRLCAYLRLNLSSKEIAPLMSISVRGVEISRYRLRKKMELPTETNLVQYLMDF